MILEPIYLSLIFLPYFAISLIFLRTRFDKGDSEIAVSSIGRKLPKYKYMNTLNFLVLGLILMIQSFELTKLLPGDMLSVIYVQIVLISGLFVLGLTFVPSSVNALGHNAFAYLLYALMSVAYIISTYFFYIDIAPFFIFIAAIANLSVLLLVLYFIGLKRDYGNRRSWDMEWLSVIVSTMFIFAQSYWIYSSIM